MCVIDGWLVVDEFSHRSEGCVYFLTHWHAGFSNSWSYGPVYCSAITARLLRSKYPQAVAIITVLELGAFGEVAFDNHFCAVAALDSNHMAGSVMLLIRTANRTVLHSGDLRYHPKIAKSNELLFQTNNDGQIRTKFPIDLLYLDNTFCDPIFQFPPRSEAIRQLADLVDELKPERLFLCTDSVGKEEVFLLLSRKFNTRVIVNPDRMEYITAMDLPLDQFSLEPDAGWIEVIRKDQVQQRLKQSRKAIGAVLSGWANFPTIQLVSERTYMVPYSLHSNFAELQGFVAAVRPFQMEPIVTHGGCSERLRPIIHSYQQYQRSLYYLKQRGFPFLREKYCRKITDLNSDP